jgi:hypothetical protein
MIKDPAVFESRGRRPGFAALLIALLLLVAGLTFVVLKYAASKSPVTRVGPALALGSGSVRGPLTPATAREAVLTFVPSGAADSLGQAMCSATGTSPCPLDRYPGRVLVRPAASGRFLVTVVMTVDLKRLLAGGEISLGHLPGSSSLKTGKLAVSTDNTIYGVSMNPNTHQAVFQYDVSRNGLKVWALDWNALGAVSQNASLQ